LLKLILIKLQGPVLKRGGNIFLRTY